MLDQLRIRFGKNQKDCVVQVWLHFYFKYTTTLSDSFSFQLADLADRANLRMGALSDLQMCWTCSRPKLLCSMHNNGNK